MIPNTDLGCKKEGVLPVTKTFPNLGNGLESLSCPLGEIVEPLIALVGFQGVKLRELLRSRGSSFAPRTAHRAQSYEPIRWASPRTPSAH